MINIYAQTFMNATRSGCVRMRDFPSISSKKRLNWFSRRKSRCIDPAKL